MPKKIFVGNLPFATTSEELKETFAAYGEVLSAHVVTDRVSGRSRGFGFVEMEPAAADAAISGLNGKELGGRPLRVDQAKERPPR
ncbi:MAG: RNA-binding protein [Deltaproteobacteria bacterium]|nr:RNA-binding protein [Deltaproteobacteria bacterium]